MRKASGFPCALFIGGTRVSQDPGANSVAETCIAVRKGKSAEAGASDQRLGDGRTIGIKLSSFRGARKREPGIYFSAGFVAHPGMTLGFMPG